MLDADSVTIRDCPKVGDLFFSLRAAYLRFQMKNIANLKIKFVFLDGRLKLHF
ncbi:hypothetical protein FAM8374_00100 [Lacticaseibacillus paracasei]|nr:hypothetical protein FAM3257_03025 [Lacticaseibacillus paracasei]RNE46756.1 hypothetical protein FAM8374_00100 [Lacticaseibacillus paracasei]